MTISTRYLTILLGLTISSVPATGLASANNSDYLIELTRLEDPVLATEAAKGLREHAGIARVQNRLIEIVADANQSALVRAEAVKGLGTNIASKSVARILGQVASDRDPKTPLVLKELAIRALSTSAGAMVESRKELQRVLNDAKNAPIGFRESAAWALFTAIGHSAVAKDLEAIAANPKEPTSLRVEAIKSLYTQAQNSRDVLMSIVQNGGDNVDVRVAATLALQTDNGNSDVRSLLLAAARDERTPQVQRAAIEALRSVLSEERMKYFHLREYPVKPRDALEYEFGAQ